MPKAKSVYLRVKCVIVRDIQVLIHDLHVHKVEHKRHCVRLQKATLQLATTWDTQSQRRGLVWSIRTPFHTNALTLSQQLICRSFLELLPFKYTVTSSEEYPKHMIVEVSS
jgi:hypothetical protein